MQQDRVAYFQIDSITILGVADGNGGIGGGEIAEEALYTGLFHILKNLSINSGIDLKELALEAIEVSAKNVLQLKETNQDWSDAGTTLTFGSISPVGLMICSTTLLLDFSFHILLVLQIHISLLV